MIFVFIIGIAFVTAYNIDRLKEEFDLNVKYEDKLIGNVCDKHCNPLIKLSLLRKR